MACALLLDDVHKAMGQGFLPRKKPILKGVSFAVNAGEIFGFLGPNGAGKTTTIKTVLNLLHADRGRIEIFGVPYDKVAARARVGFLPENPYFYDYLMGREFLEFYGGLSGLARGASRTRSGELLERVGLSHAARLPLRKYSRGMLQRVGIAQALMGDPDLVILDEPMSGLDPFGRKDIRDLILELRERGKTVFFSSHILADAELLCNRVAVMKDGQAHILDLGKLAESARVTGYEAVCRGAERKALAPFEVVTEQEGAWLVRLKDDAEKQAFLARFAAAPGVAVESLAPIRPSLESLLLSLYGDARGAEAPPSAEAKA